MVDTLLENVEALRRLLAQRPAAAFQTMRLHQAGKVANDALLVTRICPAPNNHWLAAWRQADGTTSWIHLDESKCQFTACSDDAAVAILNTLGVARDKWLQLYGLS